MFVLFQSLLIRRKNNECVVLMSRSGHFECSPKYYSKHDRMRRITATAALFAKLVKFIVKLNSIIKHSIITQLFL
jgi:hypothetical protein